MGITAVSSANLSAMGKGAASSQSEEGGGSDFAALLTQQLADPQLLDTRLQSIIAFPSGQDKNAVAELTEDDASTGQDPGDLLGLAALLPGLVDAPKAAQPSVDTAARTEPGQDKDQIAGIVGQLNNRAGSEEQKTAATGLAAREDPTAALAAEATGKETAIIAAESEGGASSGQDFAATLAAHSAQAQRAQSAGDAAASVRTPITDSRWGQDFGEKVVWLAKNDRQVAQLNINPPQLGPMQITLNLSGDQASAMFVSPHAEVRQAIQEAMPQLREMLAGAGINLGQANVGAQLPQQNGGAQPQFSAPSRSGDDNAILRAENGQGNPAPLTAMRGGRGMVDLFA